MSELVFLLGSEVDIQSAFNFYEGVQPGLGEIFIGHLEMALSQMKTFPEIAPVFGGFYRRLLVPDFPYGIFYSLEAGRILVVGVLDLRQAPRSIHRRLGGGHS